jgi:hypothetical protein
MAIVNTQYTTLTCNGPRCEKTLTFETSQQAKVLADPENAWLKAARAVTRLLAEPGQQEAKKFLYCCDVCEIKAAGTAVHNLPEPKKIIEATASPEQIKAAAEAAKAAEAATAAIKAGQPATVHVS